MPKTIDKPKPILLPALCKGCGRCIDACPKHCITMGHDINQDSGMVPILLDLEACNACGVCITACPEPYGLTTVAYQLEDPRHLYGARERMDAKPETIPDQEIPLQKCETMVLKGNHAAAIGAIFAGCRHVFGYPITPSTEGAELMAELQPQLRGVFLQAVSEVATVNHMYGCAAAGLPSMTFTSSPGFSLMLEGISYMIGSELPAVFVNVMRGGPGLGNIAPEQADIKLTCRGLGHGNTHAITLAPTTPQEMLTQTMLAFQLAFKYRNPVVVLADGYLGQMTGRVALPDEMIRPGMPDWAVAGDAAHRSNLICSIYLAEQDLEAHNEHLREKYRRMIANEQRANLFHADDADILLVACNTPARMAKGAVERLRREGVKAGLFIPVTLWPFPIEKLRPLLGHVQQILVIEASDGQLEDEMRLALSHEASRRMQGRTAGDAAHRESLRGDAPASGNGAGIHPAIHNLRHMGGVLPQEGEIVRKVRSMLEVSR
jgi:pyruvate/2-oxoacid:ferredoxin oxidoreductase alpha subunit/NAD-dependent dihydropyrimidine dehydrogenase PreA subunit